MLGHDRALLNEEDLSDWGSDFDDDIDEEQDNSQLENTCTSSIISSPSSSTTEHSYNFSNGSLSSGCSSTASTTMKDESRSNNGSIGSNNSNDNDNLYEIPDGKPSLPVPTLVATSNWRKTLTAQPHALAKNNKVILDEFFKSKKPTILAKPKPKPPSKPKPKSLLLQNPLPPTPPPSAAPTTTPLMQELQQKQKELLPEKHYIEHVLLPTRATKDEDSKNFIESLKRKLSQKNHLTLLKSNSKDGDKKHNSTNNNNANQYSKKDTQQNKPQVVSPNTELIKKLSETVQKFPWFYRVDRHKAELILENSSSDGSFLVRECSHGGPNVPFTLTIRFAQRFFHIQIRQRPEDSDFALGTMKMNEIHFSTVQELIDTYRKQPLQLHTNGKYFGETKLTQPPIVYSVSKNN